MHLLRPVRRSLGDALTELDLWSHESHQFLPNLRLVIRTAKKTLSWEEAEIEVEFNAEGEREEEGDTLDEGKGGVERVSAPAKRQLRLSAFTMPSKFPCETELYTL